MRFLGLMMMVMCLAWNLREAAGQPRVPLRGRLFTSSRRAHIELTVVRRPRRRQILNKLLSCAGNDSRINLDAFHFSFTKHTNNKLDLTALMAATLYNFNDIARTLLHYSKNYRARNKQGWTPLQLAARAGNNDILSILLDLSWKLKRILWRETAFQAAGFG